MRMRADCPTTSGVSVCLHVFTFTIESAVFTAICGWPCTASCTSPLLVHSLTHSPPSPQQILATIPTTLAGCRPFTSSSSFQVANMASSNGQAAFQPYVDPSWMSLSPPGTTTETIRTAGDGWTAPPFEARIFALSSSMASSEAQQYQSPSQFLSTATSAPVNQESKAFPSGHDPQETVITNVRLITHGLPSHCGGSNGNAQDDQGQDQDGWQPDNNAQFARPLWLQALPEIQMTLPEEQSFTTPADEASQESATTSSSWWDELGHSQAKQESVSNPNLLTAFTSPDQDTDSSSFLSGIVDGSTCQPYGIAVSTTTTCTDPASSIQPAWPVSRISMQSSTSAVVQDDLLHWPDPPPGNNATSLLATVKVDGQYPPSNGLEQPLQGTPSLTKVQSTAGNSSGSSSNASIRETSISDFSHESLSTTGTSPSASIPVHAASDNESNKRPHVPPRKRNVTRCPKKDALLLEGKRLGLSYKEIKRRGGFEEAESTLRGRYRSITKRKEERVRRPQWQPRDVSSSSCFSRSSFSIDSRCN